MRHLEINESDAHYRRVKSRLGHIADGRRVTTLDRQMIDSYVARRRQAKAKPQTIKGEVATVRAMPNWASETKRIEQNPIKKFPTIETSGLDPFLFKDDIERMIADSNLTKKKLADLGRRMVLAPKDIKRLVQLARQESPDLVLPLMLVAATGIRRSELVGLTKADIDQVMGRLTVRSGKGSRKKREHRDTSMFTQ